MVQILDESAASATGENQTSHPTKKLIGNSDRVGGGKTALSMRTLNTMDTNSLRRSLKKTKKKGTRSKNSKMVETEIFLESSNIMSVVRDALVVQPADKENVPSSTQAAKTSEATTTTSPLQQLRSALKGKQISFDSPQPSKHRLKAQENLQQPFLSPPLLALANGENTLPPLPLTPYASILSRELDADPDMSLLTLTPHQPRRVLLSTAKKSRRQPLHATKLSGRAQRIRIEPHNSTGDDQKDTETAIPMEVTSAQIKISPDIPSQQENSKGLLVRLDARRVSLPHQLSDQPEKDSNFGKNKISPKMDGFVATDTHNTTSQYPKENKVAVPSEDCQRKQPETSKAHYYRFHRKRGEPKKQVEIQEEPASVQPNKSVEEYRGKCVRITIPGKDTGPQDVSCKISPSGAVCMDLSGVFKNANSSARQKMPSLSFQTKAPTKPQFQDISDFDTVDSEPNDWADKQCAAFTEWINYVFEPNEDRDDDLERSQNATNSFRALISHQRLATARYKSRQLWQGQEMLDIRNKISHEISRGRLSIREDRDLHADLPLREQLLSLLFSYSTPWLRLGLETLFGETVEATEISNSEESIKLSDGYEIHKLSPKSKSPLNQMQHALRDFILNRVLSDKKILSKYTRRLCKFPAGKFGEKYKAEMRSISLYRLLSLFFFLDQAKTKNILEKVPRLFTINAKVKSSQEVLLAFSGICLSQQGDVVKHLSRIGLHVSYQQEPVDEIEFPVTNLAVDLRDGVRLTRLVEILTKVPAKSMLHKLRLPAVSRLQKMHNVDLVLKALRQHRVPIDEEVLPHQIVDSHRNIVLGVLWALARTYSLGAFLDKQQVANEIWRIKQSRGETFVEAGWEKIGDQEKNTRYLLLKWCDTVCSEFGVRVSNLSGHLADGVVFCLLIHFYLPNLVRLTDIRRTARSTSFMLPSKAQPDIVYRNERRNCELASNKMYSLGGLGRMIPISDSSNLPDPKVMLLCLAFIFTRVLDCNKEIRACITIQRAARERQRFNLIKRKMAAASFILGKWRDCRHDYFEGQRCKYGGAVKTIEAFFTKQRHRIEAVRKRRLEWQEIKRNIILIQSLARGMIARKQVQQLVHRQMVCTVIQCWWRQIKASNVLLTLRANRDAARTIQRAYRWAKEVDKSKNLAAVRIQSHWRKFWEQVAYQIDRLDIIAVQSCARRHLAIGKYRKHIAAAVSIQTMVRVWEATRLLGIMKMAFLKLKSATCIQSVFRRFIATKKYGHAIASATMIQAEWRKFRQQKLYGIVWSQTVILQAHARARRLAREFRNFRLAAINVQAVFRGWTQRREYCCKITKIINIQSIVRAWSAKRQASTRVNAIVALQAFERMRKTQEYFKKMKFSAVTLQSQWRSFSAWSRFCRFINMTIVIQKVARGFVIFRRFNNCRNATITVQKWGRVWVAKSKLKALREERARLEYAAATAIQSLFRGYLLRREYSILHGAAATIQTAFRGFNSRIEYRTVLLKICQIQTIARRFIAQMKAHERRLAVLRLQSLARMVKGKNAAANRRALIRAAICVQCMVRQRRAVSVYMDLLQKRRELERRNKAASIIQKRSRRFLRRYHAACTIQAISRCYLTHMEYMISMLAVLKLQSVARVLIGVKIAKERAAAVSVLQTFARNAVKQIRSAKLIQRTVRGFFVRLRVAVDGYAATVIQRYWRGYVVYREVLLWTVFAIAIQSVVRMHQARNFVKMVRMEMAAVKIQRSIRNKQSRDEFLFLRKQIIVLQSRIRGQTARAQRKRAVSAIADRINKATAKADPSKTLAARTSNALHLLLLSRCQDFQSQSLGKIMKAVTFLELATRLSKKCCEAFTIVGVSDILFNLVRTCNRSLPHEQLIQAVLETLRNVAFHEEFILPIATETAVNTLLDLIQTFRDKVIVFSLAVGLLENVVRNNIHLKYICSSDENMKRLKHVKELCKRKATYATPVTQHGKALYVSSGLRTLTKVIQFAEQHN